MTQPNFRALCVELTQCLIFSENPPWEVITQSLSALATPPPAPPTAGNTGENERLRSLFDLTRHQMADALGVDRGYGWTSLAMEARQLQEDRARAALATPPPAPPTDEELVAFLYLIDPEDELSPLAMARAALERWGNNAI